MTKSNVLAGRRIVLAPGRVGGPPSLAWLTSPLRSAGFSISDVAYSRDERSILQDACDVQAVANKMEDVDDPVGPILVGYSRGASAVLNAVADGTLASAVVAVSGASDQARLMLGYRLHAPGSRAPLALTARGDWPENDPLLYLAASTLTKAHRIRVPVLLVHGTADMVIPVDHSRWLHSALLHAGNGRATLTEIPGAGHFFERGFADSATGEVVDIIMAWLTGR